MGDQSKACKLCQGNMNTSCHYFLNKSGDADVCGNCGDYMKYLESDLVKDKLKFLRKIRCEDCNFRICKINGNSTCLWCLNDDIILRHKVVYDTYAGKTHAFVLQNDFIYCIAQTQRNTANETKLTHLTKKVLNKVSHRNRTSPSRLGDESINKRWM